MAYKVKNKKRSFTDRELEIFRQKTKGKPTAKQITREGTRVALRIPQRVHKKGQIVEYKDNVGIVDKVTKKGIYVREFKRGKDNIAKPSKSTTFISDKKIQKGEVYPAFSLPILTPYIFKL
jgi:hypothetical protein